MTFTGVTGIFSKTTRTAPETITSVYPASTSVSCSIVPDYQILSACNSITPLTWASLVITFVTIQLTWWIFDVSMLWSQGAGMRTFFDSVSWTCLKAHAAGSAGLIAIRKGRDTSQYARIYYMGMKRQDTPPEWKSWKFYTCILTDLLVIVATCITLYEACTLPAADARRQFGVELWAYPSLPVALIGLSLLLGEFFFPPTRKGDRLLLLFIISLLVLVELAVALILWKFDTVAEDRTLGMWWFSIICYIIMTFPWIFIHPPLHFFACAAGCFFRVGGIVSAAFSHYAGGQPYCKMPGPAFGAVYLALGAVAAVFALLGGGYHGVRYLRKK
jgi:hypothetical protein